MVVSARFDWDFIKPIYSAQPMRCPSHWRMRHISVLWCGTSAPRDWQRTTMDGELASSVYYWIGYKEDQVSHPYQVPPLSLEACLYSWAQLISTVSSCLTDCTFPRGRSGRKIYPSRYHEGANYSGGNRSLKSPIRSLWRGCGMLYVDCCAYAYTNPSVVYASRQTFHRPSLTTCVPRE